MEEVKSTTIVWSVHKSMVFIAIDLNMEAKQFFSSYKHNLIKYNMEL